MIDLLLFINQVFVVYDSLSNLKTIFICSSMIDSLAWSISWIVCLWKSLWLEVYLYLFVYERLSDWKSIYICMSMIDSLAWNLSWIVCLWKTLWLGVYLFLFVCERLDSIFATETAIHGSHRNFFAHRHCRTHGTYIWWWLRNRCARKTLLFDLFQAFD